MAKKYNIGDKVRIKEDLKDNKSYGDIYCNYDMMNMGGEIVTINYVDCDGTYLLDEDEHKYWWSEEMFATYIPEDTPVEEDEDPFDDDNHFVEKIITVLDFIDKFNTTSNTNVALYIRDKDYRVTMDCGDIEDSILYSTFVNAYGKMKIKSISFEYDYDNKVSIALLEVEP